MIYLGINWQSKVLHFCLEHERCTATTIKHYYPLFGNYSVIQLFLWFLYWQGSCLTFLKHLRVFNLPFMNMDNFIKIALAAALHVAITLLFYLIHVFLLVKAEFCLGDPSEVDQTNQPWMFLSDLQYASTVRSIVSFFGTIVLSLTEMLSPLMVLNLSPLLKKNIQIFIGSASYKNLLCFAKSSIIDVSHDPKYPSAIPINVTWNHSFSTFRKCSEKLIFLNPW